MNKHLSASFLYALIAGFGLLAYFSCNTKPSVPARSSLASISKKRDFKITDTKSSYENRFIFSTEKDFSPNSEEFKKLLKEIFSDSYLLPPMPDKIENQRKVNGVDINANNIRDDVENILYQSFYKNARSSDIYAISLWYAWSRQLMLNHPELLKNVSDKKRLLEQSNAERCIENNDDNAKDIDFDIKSSYSYFSALDQLIYSPSFRQEVKEERAPTNYEGATLESYEVQDEYCRIY